MKTTFKTNKNSFFKFLSLIVMSGLMQTAFAQSGSGSGSSNLSQGLKFDGYSLISGTDKNVGAKYRFTAVNDSADAVVSIDSLVNGATVQQIDDNSNGTGYRNAFQPAIKSGSVIGKSYAVFTINFLRKGTNTPIILNDVKGTALDIDGNLNLKEFAEINVGNGGTMSYMSTTTDISILPMLLPGSFMGINILGLERNGIDTSSLNNMFTAANSNGVTFVTAKFGTFTTIPSNSTRQFSVYMKGFNYTAISLPVKMASFTATLNNKNTELKWTTSSEINVSHFVVEKSTDGTNFSELGVVFAYGNVSANTDYNFTDYLGNIQSGVFYYRIRSVDNDQKSELSQTRLVKLSSRPANSISIAVFPNPVQNELRVTIPANWQNKKVAFELYSSSGMMVSRMERASSGQTESINVNNLNSGAYFVLVKCNGEIAQQKIIKQ